MRPRASNLHERAGGTKLILIRMTFKFTRPNHCAGVGVAVTLVVVVLVCLPSDEKRAPR